MMHENIVKLAPYADSDVKQIKSSDDTSPRRSNFEGWEVCNLTKG